MFYQVNEATIINLSRINYVQFEGMKTFADGEQRMCTHIYMIDDAATVYLSAEEVAHLKTALGV